MKPIKLVYLDHGEDDNMDELLQSEIDIAAHLRRRRPRLSELMTLQSDTPDGMLSWLQSSLT
jgi:hypothetical protein